MAGNLGRTTTNRRGEGMLMLSSLVIVNAGTSERETRRAHNVQGVATDCRQVKEIAISHTRVHFLVPCVVELTGVRRCEAVSGTGCRFFPDFFSNDARSPG